MNRLSSIIDINMDQSYYTIEKRSIHDIYNIHLIRDVIDFSDLENSPVAIVSFDQTKAFDRVNHSCLFRTHRAFVFAEKFINYNRLAYNNTETLLMIYSVESG